MIKLLYEDRYQERQTNMDENTRSKIEEFPVAISSPYNTCPPNTLIPLFEGELLFFEDASLGSVEQGKVFLSWSPSPTVKFEIPSLQRKIPVEQSNLKISIPAINMHGNVVFTSIPNIGSSTCKGFLNEDIKPENIEEVDHIIFHLTNFVNYDGDNIREEGTNIFWRGRLSLEANGWKVTIDRVRDERRIIKALRDEGGFGITHLAKLERSCGQPFSFEEGEKLLYNLGYFLSFLNGLWSHPLLICGIRNGNRIWQLFEIPSITPWRNIKTWLPYRSWDKLLALNTAFEGFITLASSSDWDNAVISSLHWFVEANLNAGAVEGSVILACTALELLGWSYLVKNNSILTEKEFEKSATQALQTLLSHLKISDSTPSEMSSLLQLDNNGPKALLEIRNRIVHPPSRPGQRFITQYSFEARQEAKVLALYYLELVLLKLFNYNGFYSKRFHSGYLGDSVVEVPWNSSASPSAAG